MPETLETNTTPNSIRPTSPEGVSQPLPDDGETLPRVPWSVVGPEFISSWGYPGGKFWPEHIEILGPSGSGKTRFNATILSERILARGSRVVYVATKRADDTIMSMGWPVGQTFADVQKHPQLIFWPQTAKLGEERDAYLHAHIAELLTKLWQPKANTVLAFDEVATVEDLGRGPDGKGTDIRRLIRMYWREARSMGITIDAMKQRPQGTARDMHSETTWAAAFQPKDEDDAKRYAEVLGGRRKWLNVLMQLDRDRFEFVLSNSRTRMAVITWVDTPLRPLPRTRTGDYAGR